MSIALFASGILIVPIAIAVITLIGCWKVFVKMGEPGWKGLIPVYNNYIYFRNCWEAKYFFPWFIATIIAGIFSNNNNSDNGIILSLIVSIAGILILVFTVMLNYHIAQTFGYGIGFTIGLTLLPTIFFLILGFGSAKFIGKMSDGDHYTYDSTY